MHNQPLQIFKPSFVRIALAALLILTVLPGQVTAQQNNTIASPTSSSATVPQIIQFSGTLSGAPSGTVSITFMLYENEQGGTALWSETDNVQVNAQGQYTALLGLASPEGLPMNLFTTVQAHWLAVQPLLQGFAEQPRVLLVSTPYALKAGDAETIGGLPPSAFVMAAPGTSSASGAAASYSSGLAALGSPVVTNGRPAPPPPSGSGMTNYIPIWTTSTKLGDSILYQTGGKVGVGTTTPLWPLDVSGSINTSAAYNIGGMAFAFGSSFTGNVFLGFAGNTTTTGGFNTASGYQALLSNTTGIQNTASGDYALNVNTTGSYNTANGFGALSSNGSGSQNTASGFDALFSNDGNNNTASGYQALALNTAGADNTAIGWEALVNNTIGLSNTASGFEALSGNTTGFENTASGWEALANNTNGGSNTASGAEALSSNTTGGNNTATGDGALYNNISGNNNTASGYNALAFNNASNNTANGYNALFGNSTGSNNTASGYNALNVNTTGGNNTADGYDALQNNTTGTNNIAIGYIAARGVSGGNSNNIHIGNSGSSGDNGVIRIGAGGNQASFFAAGIAGVNVSGAAVIVSSSGQLGVASSSRRYKDDIHDMGDASEGLMRLRPVTFRYKKPFDDGSKPIQYGLIAEEVAEVYPDLVARSADGQIETVKYQLLDPMLLNEVQRQNALIQDQQTQIRDLIKTQKAHELGQQNQIKAQQAQIRELASQMRILQASLRTRRGNGHASLASTKGTPAPATTDATQPAGSTVRGGD